MSLERPSTSLTVNVKYRPDGVYFSEKDFYLTIIFMIAEDAIDDINLIELHTTWPRFSSVSLRFVGKRNSEGIHFLSIKTTLEIIELFARKLSIEGNRLAEAFFYPQWNGNPLGVGSLLHVPNAVTELSSSTLRPQSISNASLSAGPDPVDLDIRLYYNPGSRQYPRKDIFWFIIEGMLAIAPLSSQAPCRALTHSSLGLTMSIKPGRSTKGLFINGIVVHLYKALALAMAEATAQGWYGDITFEIRRNEVPIATGFLKGRSIVGAVDDTDVAIS